MLDVMLDLETMGNGPQAAIVAIGAVEFDPAAQEIGRSFYRVVDLASSVRAGGVMDAGTVMWWLGQSDEARRALLATDTVTLNEALREFYDWAGVCAHWKDLRVWGNGAAFDNVILASAYRACGLQLPWQFWNDRCYRTLKALHPGVTVPREGVHHNALDDATHQAKHLLAILAAQQPAQGATGAAHG